MDAITRHYLEIEGYRDLGMWEEATEALAVFAEGIPDRPEILGFLTTLGVAIEFGGARRLPTFFVPTLPYAQSKWGQAELAKL